MIYNAIDIIETWYKNTPREILFIQFLSIISLVFYGWKSKNVLTKGLKTEYREQGIIPVLGIVYFFISVYFIFTFVSTFNSIYLANNVSLLNASNFFVDDFKTVDLIFDYSILLLLLAFTVNFSKSFFTMNSLEFGYLITSDYGKKLYKDNNKRAAIFDTLIRLAIAFFFVFLENRLSKSKELFSDNELSSFIITGWLSTALYISALIWLILNNKLDAKSQKVLNIFWFSNTLLQFISGLAISILLISIGYIHSSSSYQTLGLLFSGLIALFSILLLVTVVLNEFKPKKYYNGNN